MFSFRKPARQKICLLSSGIIIISGVAIWICISQLSSTSFAPRSPRLGTHSKIDVHGKVHENCAALMPQQVVINKSEMSEVRLHEYLNIFNASEENKEERNSINSNQCVPMRTTLGMTPICIYDPKIDTHISRKIIEKGLWEKTGVEFMASILEENPDMQFLDIGCNIGVYTLQAARMGREVVAVDANKFNLRLLSKSLNLGGLQKHAKLIWNAVSDIHEKINLTITTGNIGASFVKPAEYVGRFSEFETREALTITLDDIIVFVKGNPLFIKMDIESSEWKAFKGGERFLQEVDVRYILMEWKAYRKGNRGQGITILLCSNGFQPYEVKQPELKQLNIEDFKSWPSDVLWIKKYLL